MSASCAISHGCFIVRNLFRTASNRASFLDDHSSECQKYTEQTRNPPFTFTQAWAVLPSIPEIDSTAASNAPTNAPRLRSIARKTPPDVCLRSPTACHFLRYSCCARCKLPSFLGFSVALSITSSPQSVLHSTNDFSSTFVSSHKFPSCAPGRPQSFLSPSHFHPVNSVCPLPLVWCFFCLHLKAPPSSCTNVRAYHHISHDVDVRHFPSHLLAPASLLQYRH